MNLLDRLLAYVVNHAIGLSEDEKDALVTPAAIAQMWDDAHGQQPDTAS